jgi:hypothetical protein
MKYAPWGRLFHAGNLADLVYRREGHARAATYARHDGEDVPIRIGDRAIEAGIHALKQAEQHERNDDADCSQDRPHRPAP